MTLPTFFWTIQPDPEKCPTYIRDIILCLAGNRCQGCLLLSETLQVLIPALPMDEEPEPPFFTPYPNLWKPARPGVLEPISSPRYPEVAYKWQCSASWKPEIDRVRPRHAGGKYDIVNNGALCKPCNGFKGQKWPWFDYRSPAFKREVERFLREGNHQLWLWNL